MLFEPSEDTSFFVSSASCPIAIATSLFCAPTKSMQVGTYTEHSLSLAVCSSKPGIDTNLKLHKP